jgi:cytochrome c-type biogenesis protein CcmE
VKFFMTDKQNEILVTYRGVLPNLFREGQGVVVTGKLTDQHMLDATEVLAKHDEKYMPASWRRGKHDS